MTELVTDIPADLNAAVFIVLHFSGKSVGELLLERTRVISPLPCLIAKDQEVIKPGHIYIGPPDVHLLIKKGKIVIGHGPTENRFRPSIDVLFRSAAASYGERAIGIVLTGLLNDGTAGMWAIRQSGGHCIVQDPNQAEYPDMPLSVLETMEVDHVLPLAQIGYAIEDIISNKIIRGVSPPKIVVAESALSERAATSIQEIDVLGELTAYTCPDCGGNLWQMKNGHLVHYRCHIGHSYSEKELGLKQKEDVEGALWVGVRMMEERKFFLMKMATQHIDKGLVKLGTHYRQQAERLETHIINIKDLLFKGL